MESLNEKGDQYVFEISKKTIEFLGKEIESIEGYTTYNIALNVLSVSLFLLASNILNGKKCQDLFCREVYKNLQRNFKNIRQK